MNLQVVGLAGSGVWIHQPRDAKVMQVVNKITKTLTNGFTKSPDQAHCPRNQCSQFRVSMAIPALSHWSSILSKPHIQSALPGLARTPGPSGRLCGLLGACTAFTIWISALEPALLGPDIYKAATVCKERSVVGLTSFAEPLAPKPCLTLLRCCRHLGAHLQTTRSIPKV